MRNHLAIAVFTLLITSPAMAQVKPAPEETAPVAATSTPGGAIPNDSNTLNRPSTTDGHAGSRICEKMSANTAGGAMAEDRAGHSLNNALGNSNETPNPNCPPQTNGPDATTAPSLRR